MLCCTIGRQLARHRPLWHKTLENFYAAVCTHLSHYLQSFCLRGAGPAVGSEETTAFLQLQGCLFDARGCLSVIAHEGVLDVDGRTAVRPESCYVDMGGVEPFSVTVHHIVQVDSDAGVAVEVSHIGGGPVVVLVEQPERGSARLSLL